MMTDRGRRQSDQYDPPNHYGYRGGLLRTFVNGYLRFDRDSPRNDPFGYWSLNVQLPSRSSR